MRVEAHRLGQALTGLLGDGYDGAGGFTIINWATDVEQCIRFPGYPQKMP